MAISNGAATPTPTTLFTIKQLIPERKNIEIEGEFFEVKAPEEFGAKETAQIMRYAQGVTKFADLFTADEDSSVPDDIEKSVSGIVAMFVVDMKPAMRNKIPFSAKMGLSQALLQHFMSGLTALNTNPTTAANAAPTPLRETLGQIAHS